MLSGNHPVVGHLFARIKVLFGSISAMDREAPLTARNANG
jgi:hypothetical protein